MGEAYLKGKTGGGGLKLKNTIEDYQKVGTGETINVGDFVNYNDILLSSETFTSALTSIDSTEQNGMFYSVVALPNNRVFIAHKNTTSGYLKGTLLAINGATITVVYSSSITSNASIGDWGRMKVVLLDDTNVFIAFCGNSGNNFKLYCTTITISDTDFSINGITQISSEVYTGYSLDAIKMDDETIFVAHSYTDNYQLAGTIVKLSNNLYSSSTTSILNSKKYIALETISVAKISPTRVFVYGNSDNTNWFGVPHLVDIAQGINLVYSFTETLTYSGYYHDAVTLSGNRVLVIHSYTNFQLYGTVYRISDSTITKITSYSILPANYQCFAKPQIALLKNGNIAIPHTGSNTYYLNALVIHVDESNLLSTPKTNIQLGTGGTGYTPCCVQLSSGDLFFPQGTYNYYYLKGQVLSDLLASTWTRNEYEIQVTKAIEPPFDGIALMDGTDGENIKISIPNTEVNN